MHITHKKVQEILRNQGLEEQHIEAVLSTVRSEITEETARNIGRIIGDTVRHDSQKS